jgi:hypothetical protein
VPAAVLADERELSRLPLKGMLDAIEFAKRVAATFKCRAASAGFRGSVAARRKRFLRDSRAKAADARILHQLVAEKLPCDSSTERPGLAASCTGSVVLAVGNGYSGAQPRPGERYGRSRVKGLVRYLARFMRVVQVDEFRTSANCAACLAGKMVYARDRDGQCNACGGKRNRDANACSLILDVVRSLLETGKRPAPLRRAGGDDKDMPAAGTQ